MPQRLEQLLTDADVSEHGSSQDPADLARGAKRIARRRRTIRRASGVTAAILLALAALPFLNRHEPTPHTGSRLTPDQVALLRMQIAALSEQAERSERMVALMTQAQQKRRAPVGHPSQPPLDVVDELLLERDRAASILVHSADRMARPRDDVTDPASRQAARQEYNRVVELFPDSTWARVARQRAAALSG